MLFSERIRLLRQERGLTQRKLAQAIGVDTPMYSRYEHGERRPKRAQVVKLARLLHTDANELVALWLAEEALNTIGHDKMSNRAAELLRDTLEGVDTAALPDEDKGAGCGCDEGPQGAVVVSQTADVDPAILKAPECDPRLRNLVSKLGRSTVPQYHCGEASQVMALIEDKSGDCIVTSLPYWHLRRYKVDSLATSDVGEFVNGILRTTAQAMRVLKDEGSLWINMADAYNDSSMQALPWRLAIKMMDLQGWMLRNDIVWNKQQGTLDGSQNHARNEHEYMFHFVKSTKYYYDDKKLSQNMDNDKSSPAKTGERYRRAIAGNTRMTQGEKNSALNALNAVLSRVNSGAIGSFKLYLREAEAPTGIDAARAGEVNAKGFSIQEFPRSTSMPGDVWNIAPERSETDRYVVGPQQRYKLAIVATCPRGGLVGDPYCGTGTACKVAQ